MGARRHARAAVRRRVVRRGNGRLRRPQRRRSRSGAAGAAARAAPRRTARHPRDHDAAGCLAPFYRVWFDHVVPASREGAARAAMRTRTSRRASAGSRRRASSPICWRRAASAPSVSASLQGVSWRFTSARWRGRSEHDDDAGRDSGDPGARGVPRRDRGTARAHRREPSRARRGRRQRGARRGRQAASAAARLPLGSARRGAVARRRRRGRARPHGDARTRRPHRPRALPARQGGGLVGATGPKPRGRQATTSSREPSRS